MRADSGMSAHTLLLLVPGRGAAGAASEPAVVLAAAVEMVEAPGTGAVWMSELFNKAFFFARLLRLFFMAFAQPSHEERLD